VVLKKQELEECHYSINMPYIGRPIDAGDFKVITLSESFDGNRVDFTMSESVGTVNQLIVVLSGVVQHWTDAYTVSGTTLTFSSAPASGESIKILKLGSVLSPNVPASQSVGVSQLSTTGIAAGKVFKVNDAGNAWELGNASSAEIYIFNKNSNNLNVVTTNGGQDNITNAVYAAADEKMFAASGFTFSINASGNLIATI
tara:strand:- start:92 stop:691 length:600 start_codon:yes stop_codon:yes gene_type:complete